MIAPRPGPVGYDPETGVSYYPHPQSHAHAQGSSYVPLSYQPVDGVYYEQQGAQPSSYVYYSPETPHGHAQAPWAQDNQLEYGQLEAPHDHHHLAGQALTPPPRFTPPPPQESIEYSHYPAPMDPQSVGVTPLTPPSGEPLEIQANFPSQRPEIPWSDANGRMPTQTTIPVAPELLQRSWEEEDNASLTDSDDSSLFSREGSHFDLNEMGLVAQRKSHQPYDIYGTQARTFSYADGNFLTNYHPSPLNSPLNDKQIASVFFHFIRVTGPSISLYERHPADPFPIFQGKPIPKGRQHLWTCTYPRVESNPSPCTLANMH